jgi:hypothetical protein
MLRVIRAISACLLVVLAILALLIWATAPSPKPGQLLLPPKTDFTKQRFFAYVGPWGGELAATTRLWSRFADAMIIDLKRFPANTKITWRWPPFAPTNGAGVWGYNWVAYDNYAGGLTEQRVEPTRVRDLKVFRQTFRWSIENRWGDANVLTEFYLRSNATDVEANRIEIGWFLHAPARMRQFFDHSRLVGAYVDPTGRRWTARMVDKYCMFALEKSGDLPEGELDMLHAIRWLQQRGLVTGDEWLWGVGIGAEPITGLGDMTLHEWHVVRQ